MTLSYRRRRPGLGYVFGLFFLWHHPILLVVIALVVLAVFLYLRRR